MKKTIMLILNIILTNVSVANMNQNQELEDELAYLHAERYVYSASKHNQQISKAPASISIVTAEQIKKYGYRNFGDIIASLKGFYHTYDRGYGFIGTRGFGLPSDFNTRLLLLVDGYRFNETIYDSFDSSEAFPLDIDAIERVEVVRGPGSALYGSNAVFGVINVISKHGKNANIKTSYGSFNATKTSLSYGQQFANGLEAFATGSFYHSQGNSHLYFKEFDSPSTNNGISEHNDKDQSEKLLAKLSYQDFKVQGLFAKRNKALPTASLDTLFNSHDENITDERIMLNAGYDHTFANQLNLQARLSYHRFFYLGHYPYDYGTPETAYVINQDYARAQWWQAEWQASKVFWDAHHLTIGGEFQDNFEQRLANYDIESYLNFRTHTYRWAIFLQDEISLTDNLTLNAGLRFDHFSNFGSTINPRVGLIYDIWDNNTIKLLYGSAFRAPTQFELHLLGTGVIPNPNLKPEVFKTLELILEHRFNNSVNGEINLFYTSMTNLIQFTQTEDGALQNRNVGNVKSMGVEAQLEGKWTNGWQTRFSYSWQKTIDRQTRQRLSNSPEHMLKLNLIAPLWTDKVFASFETRYLSSRKTPTPHNDKVHGYAISNLTLFSQNWLMKGLELSGGVYNLFNQRYFDPGSTELKQNGLEQDHLTFRIKASLDF